MMKLVSHAPVDAAADQVIQLFKNVAISSRDVWSCLLALHNYSNVQQM